MTGQQLKDVEFLSVRGMKGIKEAEIDLNGNKNKFAVPTTLKNARFCSNRFKMEFHPILIRRDYDVSGRMFGRWWSAIPTNFRD
jgi:hypothetical protein